MSSTGTPTHGRSLLLFHAVYFLNCGITHHVSPERLHQSDRPRITQKHSNDL